MVFRHSCVLGPVKGVNNEHRKSDFDYWCVGNDGRARACLQTLKAEQDGSDHPHGAVILPALFVAGGQTPILLQTVDQPLDAIALFIQLTIKGTAAALVGFARDRDSGAPTTQGRPNGPIAVGFVPAHAVGTLLGAPRSVAADMRLCPSPM